MEPVNVSDASIHGTPCYIHGGVCQHDWEWQWLFRAVGDNFRKRANPRSGRAYSFLFFLYPRTISADPCTLSCSYDAKAFAEELEIPVARMREILSWYVKANVLRFSEDTLDAPKGVITWNINFTEWQQMDCRRKKGGQA